MLDGTGVIAASGLATRRRRKDLRVQALVGLAAVLALVAAAWSLASRATPDPGPLAVGPTGGGLSGGPAVRGEWEVTTIFTNRLAGAAPAVIDSVSPAVSGLAPGIVFRYGVLGKVNHGAPGLERGWPPGGDQMLPLRGTVVQPGQLAAIVVGAASRNVGHWLVPAFTVRYHVGRVRYAATFERGIDVRVVPMCRACTGDGQLAGRLAA